MSIRRRDTKRGTRYDVRLRGPDGREVSRTFRTEREARLFEAEERIAAMQRGGWVDPRSAATPFADVAAEWIDSNLSKRPSTLARDDVTLRRHILPTARHETHRPDHSRSEVQALVQRWLTERKPSSVARDYRTLAAIFHFAVDRELHRPLTVPAHPAPQGPTPWMPRHRRPGAGPTGEGNGRPRPGSTSPPSSACAGARSPASASGAPISPIARSRSPSRSPAAGAGASSSGSPSPTPATAYSLCRCRLVELLQAHLDAHGLTKADPAAFVFAAPGRRTAPLRQLVPPGLGTGRRGRWPGGPHLPRPTPGECHRPRRRRHRRQDRPDPPWPLQQPPDPRSLRPISRSTRPGGGGCARPHIHARVRGLSPRGAPIPGGPSRRAGHTLDLSCGFELAQDLPHGLLARDAGDLARLLVPDLGVVRQVVEDLLLRRGERLVADSDEDRVVSLDELGLTKAQLRHRSKRRVQSFADPLFGGLENLLMSRTTVSSRNARRGGSLE